MVAAAAAAQADAAAQEAARVATAAATAQASPDAAPGGGRGRGGFGGAGIGTGPVFDARLPLLFPNLDSRANSRIKLLWISIGTTDVLLGVNRQFRSYLQSKAIKHTYTEFPNEGHVWPLWRRNFAEFAQLIFK